MGAAGNRLSMLCTATACESVLDRRPGGGGRLRLGRGRGLVYDIGGGARNARDPATATPPRCGAAAARRPGRADRAPRAAEIATNALIGQPACRNVPHTSMKSSWYCCFALSGFPPSVGWLVFTMVAARLRSEETARVLSRMPAKWAGLCPRSAVYLVFIEPEIP